MINKTLTLSLLSVFFTSAFPMLRTFRAPQLHAHRASGLSQCVAQRMNAKRLTQVSSRASMSSKNPEIDEALSILKHEQNRYLRYRAPHEPTLFQFNCNDEIVKLIRATYHHSPKIMDAMVENLEQISEESRNFTIVPVPDQHILCRFRDETNGLRAYIQQARRKHNSQRESTNEAEARIIAPLAYGLSSLYGTLNFFDHKLNKDLLKSYDGKKRKKIIDSSILHVLLEYIKR